MHRAAIAAIVGFLAVGVALAVLLSGAASPTGPRIAQINVSVGQPVRHDDFFFTVERAMRTHLGSRRDRLTVVVGVDNHAKRVAYDWSPSIAYAIDSRGRRYAANVRRSSPATNVPAGASVTETIVYEVDSAARDLRLGYWDGVLMGDVFDGLAYARTRVALGS